MRKLIRWFCWGYTALLLCGGLVGFMIGFTTTYGDRSGIGCSFYDALIYGIDCRGFIGATAVEVLVGFPLLLAQFSVIATTSATLLVAVLPLWLPVFATLYFFLKRLTSRSKGRAESGRHWS
jgi:hypothetical protein